MKDANRDAAIWRTNDTAYDSRGHGYLCEAEIEQHYGWSWS